MRISLLWGHIFFNSRNGSGVDGQTNIGGPAFCQKGLLCMNHGLISTLKDFMSRHITEAAVGEKHNMEGCQYA